MYREDFGCGFCCGLPAAGDLLRAARRPPTVLDQHCFRALGKLVVGKLDRIANVDDVGD